VVSRRKQRNDWRYEVVLGGALIDEGSGPKPPTWELCMKTGLMNSIGLIQVNPPT